MRWRRSASPTSRCRPPPRRSGGRSSRPRRPLPRRKAPDMKDFEFHRPTTLAEAVRLVKAHEGAKFLSGGQSLLPVLKLELAEPSDLVSLAQLKLRDIRVDGPNLIIGALATHDMVNQSPDV